MWTLVFLLNQIVQGCCFFFDATGLMQLGFGNLACSLQLGVGNLACSLQLGVGNLACSLQLGFGNLACSLQFLLNVACISLCLRATDLNKSESLNNILGSIDLISYYYDLSLLWFLSICLVVCFQDHVSILFMDPKELNMVNMSNDGGGKQTFHSIESMKDFGDAMKRDINNYLG